MKQAEMGRRGEMVMWRWYVTSRARNGRVWIPKGFWELTGRLFLRIRDTRVFLPSDYTVRHADP